MNTCDGLLAGGWTMGYPKGISGLAMAGLLAAAPLGVRAADYGYGDPGWRGFYLGAGVGDFRYKQEGEANGVDFSFDESDTAYKAFLGFRFNPYIGLEGAYADLGSPSNNVSALGGSRLKVDTEAWYGYLVGYLPVANVFDLFGKAGVADWQVNTRIRGDGFTGEIDRAPDGTDFAWGLGAQVNLPLNLSVRGEFERIQMDEGPLKDLDNYLISLSVLLHF